MKKQRKHYTPEEKVAILRRHLVEGVPISSSLLRNSILRKLSSRNHPCFRLKSRQGGSGKLGRSRERNPGIKSASVSSILAAPCTIFVSEPTRPCVRD
jgi:hypothetical protein